MNVMVLILFGYVFVLFLIIVLLIIILVIVCEVFIFQVLENGVWNELCISGFMDNLDEFVYDFVKVKVVEVVVELLEKRINVNGLVFLLLDSCFVV